MGVNEYGVVIGNEVVFIKLICQCGIVLFGMDLLCLGLECGVSVCEVLEVIIGLLQCYGQGGLVGYCDKCICYDNSFFIVDFGEVWVLEIVGNLWVVKKVECWVIFNVLIFGYEFDLCSCDFEDQVCCQGCWDGCGDFYFVWVFDICLLFWVGGVYWCCWINQCFFDSLFGELDWYVLFVVLCYYGLCGDYFCCYNNCQVCMYVGSFWWFLQIIVSLVVCLCDDGLLLVVIGILVLCLGLFQLLFFDLVFGVVVFSQLCEVVQEFFWWCFEVVYCCVFIDCVFCWFLCSGCDWLEWEFFVDFEQFDWLCLVEDVVVWYVCWYDQVVMQLLVQQCWWCSYVVL